MSSSDFWSTILRPTAVEIESSKGHCWQKEVQRELIRSTKNSNNNDWVLNGCIVYESEKGQNKGRETTQTTR